MANKESELRIHRMTPDDIEAIRSIDRKISGLDRSLTYDINNVIGGNIELSFIAEVDDKAVGFVLSLLGYVPHDIVEACIIQTIGVAPDYRGRGIASKLVQALLEAARSKGIRMLSVMMDKKDSKLIGLFEHLSFTRGRFINYSKIL